MESGSRVGDIKKKFEGLNESTVNSNSQFRHNLKKTVLSPEIRPSVKSVALIDNSSQENQLNNPCNSGNKGNIKRSHAFRSDKHNRPFSSQGTSSVNTENKFGFNDRNKPDVLNKKDIAHGSEKSCEFQTAFNLVKNKYKGQDSRTVENLSKSSCDQSKLINNNVNLCTDTSNFPKDICYSVVQKHVRRQTENSVKSQELRIQKNIQVQARSSISTGSQNLKPNGNRLSATSKVKFEETKKVIESDKSEREDFVLSEHSLTNTLKEALKSPLPVGPPPKKPPRTFAHKCISGKLRSLSDETCLEKNKTVDHKESPKAISPSKPVVRPIRSKTESQIMLKKLELVLLHHQKSLGNSVNENGADNRQTTLSDQIKGKRDSRVPLPSIPLPDEKLESKSFCFGSLNCSGSMEFLKSPNIYDTPFEPKSTFFIGKLNSSPRTAQINIEKENSDKLCNRTHRSESEPLYAEPMISSNKPSSRVGGKRANILSPCDKNMNKLSDQADCATNIKTSVIHSNGLYYMSSPVLNCDRFAHMTGDEVFTKAVSSSNVTPSSSDAMKPTDVTTASLEPVIKSKVQMMVNEAYGKCMNLPQDEGSDSESAASIPDDSAQGEEAVCQKRTAVDASQKEREREQRTAERKGYLRRVCSRGKSFHRPASTSDVSPCYPHLFEYLLLVGLDLDPTRCKVPYIKAKYPPDASPPNGIEDLCFPDAMDWPPQACIDETGCGISYCLVLTNADGSRKYGYCRRVKPEGAPICLPLAYCIVSPFKANVYFSQVLAELESRHGQPENKLSAFIQELYACPFPSPGQGLFVKQSTADEKTEILVQSRDPRQEEVDIIRLLRYVRLSIFFQMFGTLLLERKVILLSHSISKLSGCIEGLQAALYPFHWQHTLVPIVPFSMLDVCEAPTPYLIGLLKQKDVTTEPVLPLNSIDQVLVVDVDVNRILRCMGDESSVLPSRLSRGLRIALQYALSESVPSITEANLIASEALIRLFVELVGHYREHIITNAETRKRDFQRENFVKGVSSNSIQHFLDWFSETAMFTAFIESRLDRTVDPRGLFEQRCVEYMSSQKQQNFLNYKVINRRVKNLGDRFKDWAALT